MRNPNSEIRGPNSEGPWRLSVLAREKARRRPLAKPQRREAGLPNPKSVLIADSRSARNLWRLSVFAREKVRGRPLAKPQRREARLQNPKSEIRNPQSQMGRHPVYASSYPAQYFRPKRAVASALPGTLRLTGSYFNPAPAGPSRVVILPR